MTDRTRPATRALPVLEGREQARLSTWVQMVRTFYRMQRRVVSALTEHDVTLPQFDLLATLRFSEGVTQQELAERLLVTKGNVCNVLDRLERLDWVKRQADPKDGRSNRLYLTSAGRRKIESLLPMHDAIMLDAMKDLTDGDIRMLRRTLETLDAGNNQP